MLSSLHRILAQLAPRLMSYSSLLLSLILPLIVLDVANAASFDCEKASSKVEKLICKNEEISVLDEKMASTYREALQHALNPQALRKEQKAWLNLRNLCRPEDIRHDPPKGYVEVSCLREVYKSRTQQLQMRYLQPADKLPSVIEFLAKEKNIKLESEQMPGDGAQCEDIIRQVRSGQDVHVIHPTVTRASINSPEMRKYLKGCGRGMFGPATVYAPWTYDGNQYTGMTGRIRTQYDSHDLWTLTGVDGKKFMVRYGDSWYFDVVRHYVGDIVPHWVAGPYFSIISQPGCIKISAISTVPWPGPGPLGGIAPPERRQSEIIRYNDRLYILGLGNLALPGESDYPVIKISTLSASNIQSLCTYTNIQKAN